MAPEDNTQYVQQNSTNNSYKELQHLILGLSSEELSTLQSWLKDKSSFTDEIGHILPQAVLKSIEFDEPLSDSLMPIIEKAIFESVQKNPKALADALFPIMGPAIRKSISDTFRKMIQSLNETLENQFSTDRIKWRLESIFSRQSYAEIVLLKGLPFKAKHVFLIHKETGLLINEATSESEDFDSSDMVSSMLTAVQDFVRDSFSGELKPEDTLDTIKLNDFNVWIEDGPFALLAVVFEGTAPESKREIFKEKLEEIHKSDGQKLKDFDGDTDAFIHLQDTVDSCLITQEKENNSKQKKITIVVLSFLAALLITFIVFNQIQKHRWNSFTEELSAEPGMIIVNHEKSSGTYHIQGLKDQLSSPANAIAVRHKLDTNDIVYHWKTYLSTEEEILIKRFEKALQPPDGVNYTMQDGTLIVEGSTDTKWILKAKAYLSNNPFFLQVQTSELIDTRLEQREALQKALAEIHIQFVKSKYKLTDSHCLLLDRVVEPYLHYISKESQSILGVHLTLDNTGIRSQNTYYANKRFQYIQNYLEEKGISTEQMKFIIHDVENSNPRTISFQLSGETL